MGLDVIQKIYSGNAVRNGSAVVGCSKEGDIYSLPPVKNVQTNVVYVEGKLTNRFDDADFFVRTIPSGGP